MEWATDNTTLGTSGICNTNQVWHSIQFQEERQTMNTWTTWWEWLTCTIKLTSFFTWPAAGRFCSNVVWTIGTIGFSLGFACPTFPGNTHVGSQYRTGPLASTFNRQWNSIANGIRQWNRQSGLFHIAPLCLLQSLLRRQCCLQQRLQPTFDATKRGLRLASLVLYTCYRLG